MNRQNLTHKSYIRRYYGNLYDTFFSGFDESIFPKGAEWSLEIRINIQYFLLAIAFSLNVFSVMGFPECA